MPLFALQNSCKSAGSDEKSSSRQEGPGRNEELSIEARGAIGYPLDVETALTGTTEGEGQCDDAADVFGNEAGAEVHYKTCEWWHTGVLMIAETISLGVLALPQALAHLGLLPGMLLILGLGLAATYTGYLIGQFKLTYPSVHSWADCGEMIAGRVGREVMAFGSVLILIFIMAAHVLSFAIAVSAMVGSSKRALLFSVAGLLVSFVLALPRTYKNVSYVSIFSCFSVVIAVTVAMAGIAVEKPDMGNVQAVVPGKSLVEGLGPVMNIILAFVGHVAYFSFCAEMREPRDFAKALAFMQIIAVSFYLLISATIYCYAGPDVGSPALNSASPLIRKIAYGIALPTIVVAGVVNGSVACKYIYFRTWSGTDVAHEKSFKSVGSWAGIVGVSWLIAWIIAGAVPNFNMLLGLIAALFGSWFSYGLPPVLWLYQHKGTWLKTRKTAALTVLNFGFVIMGTVICVLGLWSSASKLGEGAAGKSFSFANQGG